MSNPFPIHDSEPDNRSEKEGLAAFQKTLDTMQAKNDTATMPTDENPRLRQLAIYRCVLDDLNDIATSLLNEASINGDTAIQRDCIAILTRACAAAEWVDMEHRRISR